MACAYNVEALVEKLLANDADCNTMNSFGYSPLLEACHRGYLQCVEALIKAGASLTHVPPDAMSSSSPFAAAPAHSALGESARCGFAKIVSVLIENGAPINDTNSLGWTPLHEACFYNRREVVEILLDAGADATMRTLSGALPYHLSGLEEVRALIGVRGSPDAVPAQGDTVNMLDILHEITMGVSKQNGQSGAQPMFTTQLMGDNEDEDEDDEDEMFALMQLMNNEMSAQFDEMDADVEQQMRDQKLSYGELDDEEEAYIRNMRKGGIENKATPGKNIDREVREYAADDYTSEPALLHSGPMLGNLPSLGGAGSPEHAVQRSGRDLDTALGAGDKSALKAAKKKKKKPKMPAAEGVPADMPQRFLCQLSRRPMQEPVQSIYGNVFELTTIRMWFQQQGQICPLTGAPLVEADLKPLPDLAQEMVQWLLNKSKAPSVTAEQPAPTVDAAAGAGKSAKPTADDDMYEF